MSNRDEIEPSGLTPAQAAKNVTLGGVIEIVTAVVAAGIKCATTPLDRRIFELETRAAVVEARSSLQYCGVFEVHRQYSRGDFVTHDGSLWHCNRTTKETVPGFNPDVWTLAVKRGRDGKGARS